MRKMILMAVASFIWKRFKAYKAKQAAPVNVRRQAPDPTTRL